MYSEIPGLTQSPIVNHSSLFSAQSANQNSPCSLQGEPITSIANNPAFHVIPAHLSSLETADSSVQLNCGGIDDGPVTIKIENDKPNNVQDLGII